MSTRHDARLAPVVAGAWVAALVATGGAATGAAIGALVVAVAGAVMLVVLRTARVGPRAVLQASVAVCLLAGAAGVATAAVAGTRVSVETTQAQALVTAGATDAWVTIDGQPAPMRAFDGSERWRAKATVTAWRPACTPPAHCEPWNASHTPVVAVLDDSPQRGDVIQVGATWTESDRPPQQAIAWEARYQASGPASSLVEWRQRFAAATSQLPAESRGLVRGMAVGDTSAMPQQQEEHMRVAGLAHLTAVSGAHFAILVMTCVAVLGALRAPRAIRALAVLVTAGVFAAVVGPESSVLRAFAMACAVALALAWGRPARGCAALLVGVTVLLVIDPWLARSIGFAMSVFAVAAIVLWSPRIAAMAARIVTPGFARVAAIPIAAQAIVTPLLVVMEPGIGPYAVVANLAAGVVVLPTMLTCALTLALAAISVSLASLVAPVAGFFASGIALVARISAQAPGAWLQWPAGTLGVVLAAAITLALIFATVRVRLQYRVVATIMAIALTGAGMSGADPARAQVPDDWDVAACDIGQGDMLLLRAGPDAAVVIDTGPPDSGAGECLRRHRIGHVPLLVLTHPHLDHDGAVPDVLRVADVDQAWVSHTGIDGVAAALVAGNGGTVSVPHTGERFAVGDVVVEAVSELHLDANQGENDSSVIVRAQVGDTSVIALGDLEVAGQRALLNVLGGDAAVDVVKVAHHGSAQQLPALVERLAATVALVSVGADNRHNHPTASALELYGTYAQAVLRTDTCGDVHVSATAGELRWSECP